MTELATAGHVEVVREFRSEVVDESVKRFGRFGDVVRPAEVGQKVVVRTSLGEVAIRIETDPPCHFGFAEHTSVRSRSAKVTVDRTAVRDESHGRFGLLDPGGEH
jgi:hypothetical protein